MSDDGTATVALGHQPAIIRQTRTQELTKLATAESRNAKKHKGAEEEIMLYEFCFLNWRIFISYEFQNCPHIYKIQFLKDIM